MKIKNLILAGTVAIASMSFTAKTTDYTVDKQASKIGWVGRKVTGEHSGNINVTEGKISVDGKAIKGGKFIIDMNSMTNTDITDETYKQKLVGHLKSDDFFSTAKHPTATFVLKNATAKGENQYNLKGDLTIKGITKEVEFPATVNIAADKITAKAKILVDRTKYDIKYGSGSFFDNLGDKAIDDNFELNVDLVAKK
jgi:polyisoprenoid-binding protein YceI